jgi:hypothetical protein
MPIQVRVQVLGFLYALLGFMACSQAQRKPERVEAPKFSTDQYKSVFFNDAASMLKGARPTSQDLARPAPSPASTQINTPAVSVSDADPMAWHNLISPSSLEDLIKGAKLRLDQTITTPAAFAGGGAVVARKEFSLLALLFAIVEKHPGEVRWKSSAPIARDLMMRVAANTKIGTQQVYAEAKKRLADLGDLTNGSQLSGDASTEIPWSQLIDRVPLMQLLEWARTDFIAPQSASPTEFEKNKESLTRYAELISVLGKAALIEEMPDATDKDYVALANEMILQSQQIVLAVKTGNAELARQSAAKVGQSCTKCHESFQ